jgi:hypothetical protein
MSKKNELITTQDAAERSGVHITTIKRWVRGMMDRGENVHIQIEKQQMGRFRYLIDSDFFDQHFTPQRQRAPRLDSLTNVRIQLAEKDNLVEQQRILIKQQQDLIEVLTTRLHVDSPTKRDDE